MAINDFSGKFLNVKSTEDGDIIEIMNECVMKYSEGLKKECPEMDVKRGDKIMVYNPSDKAGRAFQEAWGKDSKDWIGKKFQVLHIDGKMVIKPLKI